MEPTSSPTPRKGRPKKTVIIAVAVTVAGFLFALFFFWLKWPVYVSLTPNNDQALQQSLERSGSFLAGVATLLIAAVAISIPLIMTAWDSVLDGLYRDSLTIVDAIREARTPLQRRRLHSIFDEQVATLTDADHASYVARLVLRLILWATLLILLWLFVAHFLLFETVTEPAYYVSLTLTYGLVLWLAFMFIGVVLFLLNQGVLNRKLAAQINHIAFIKDELRPTAVKTTTPHPPSRGVSNTLVLAILGTLVLLGASKTK